MKEEDLDAVVLIENLSFSYPWKKKQFAEELKNDHSHILVATVEVDGEKKIIGYICWWIIEDEIHILNLAIHPDFRRKGVASALLENLVSYAYENRISLLTLEVRRFNSPAIQLYKKFGFRVTGIRKRYYPEGEDALIMERKLEVES